ncbi:serine/threonine-protein kinase [Candidatus Uabimicrobium sp. HlEnr_7]|uniref:serine/threonine-protein kinase n=1 Tax=Candidatus Uabimicrobium helgolandensis TaxID=3095367 RepID=UPI003557895F
MSQSDFQFFDIQKMIGQGAMGKVYQAFDKKLQRDVALKVMSGEQITDKDVARFYREANAMAKLNHPNIVQLYNFGQHQGYPFFTMELIPGTNLKDYVENKRLKLVEIVSILQKVAQAVHYAHENGIIHRDLKPENIMMNGREPKVMDFGLAKVEGAKQLSRSGEIFGTIAYMSPEQVLANKVDKRSDVYALGVILYELLTKKRPFYGKASKMMQQIIEKEPLSPRKHSKKIPIDLETICLKCLEKKVANRYANAKLLVADLKKFSLGKPIKAKRSLSSSYLGVRFSKIILSTIYLSIAFFLVFLIFPTAKKKSINTKIADSKIKKIPKEKSKNSLLQLFANTSEFNALKNIFYDFSNYDKEIIDVVKFKNCYYFLSATPASRFEIRNIANSYQNARLAKLGKDVMPFIRELLAKHKITSCLVLNNAEKPRLIDGDKQDDSYGGDLAVIKCKAFLYEWRLD